ncbi:MAG: 4'-phosphopantetheinyl transferase superfamily protein [Bacteroidetes bacterium]|nr:4'-phosphopantetheinyl transferase superfamily protein [Bacteroidota bacterium]
MSLDKVEGKSPRNLIDFGDLPEGFFVRQAEWGAYSGQNVSSILTEEELLRREEMKHPLRKNGFTLGRIALRLLLSDILSIPANKVTLAAAPSGQLMNPDSNFHVSLAHSGETALAVAAPRPVGIDLEDVRAKPSQLLDYILADGERNHIASLDVPESMKLFLCWTLKESVLKGMGVGLRSSPRNVNLKIDTATATAQIVDPTGQIWQARYCISGQSVSALSFSEF